MVFFYITNTLLRNMLQEFLNQSLLQVPDEGNLDRLKKAAEDLAKKIEKSKSKFVSYLLTAIDPNIPPNDPLISEAKEIVIKYWNTFTSNAKDAPVAFVRAVILEALEVVSKDINFACLAWLSARSSIKFLNLGKDKIILENYLSGLGQRIENEASKIWMIQQAELVLVELKKTEFENGLKAAAIHSGYGEGGENPQVPSTGNAEWGKFFASKASEVLVNVINRIAKSNSDFLKRNNILQLRNQLLWWKEACYSPSLKISYRTLHDGGLQYSLAFDYANQVPHIYPQNVEFFLSETHNGLLKKTDDGIKISAFLKQIEECSDLLKPIISEPQIEDGRILLAKFIRGLVWGKYKLKDFNDRLGIKDNHIITLSELTIWLYRDFQVLKVSNA